MEDSLKCQISPLVKYRRNIIIIYVEVQNSVYFKTYQVIVMHYTIRYNGHVKPA